MGLRNHLCEIYNFTPKNRNAIFRFTTLIDWLFASAVGRLHPTQSARFLTKTAQKPCTWTILKRLQTAMRLRFRIVQQPLNKKAFLTPQPPNPQSWGQNGSLFWNKLIAHFARAISYVIKKFWAVIFTAFRISKKSGKIRAFSLFVV